MTDPAQIEQLKAYDIETLLTLISNHDSVILSTNSQLGNSISLCFEPEEVEIIKDAIYNLPIEEYVKVLFCCKISSDAFVRFRKEYPDEISCLIFDPEYKNTKETSYLYTLRTRLANLNEDDKQMLLNKIFE